MSENLEKENKELKEKLDFLTQEMKEIKETLKLVSSKERETKKILDNNNLNRSPEETAKFVESALKADPVDCNNNNLLHEITKDYLIELFCDMRVADVFFTSTALGSFQSGIPRWDYLKVDNTEKDHPHYRSLLMKGQILKKSKYPKLFNFIERSYITIPKLYTIQLPDTTNIKMEQNTDDIFTEYNFLAFGYKEGDLFTAREQVKTKYFLHPSLQDPNTSWEFRVRANNSDKWISMSVYNEIYNEKLKVSKIGYLNGSWRIRY